MSSQLLTHTNGNGTKPKAQPAVWKQQSLKQFFSSVNWDDHPPEVQKLKAEHAAQTANQTFSPIPLSLKLTVQQFFNAINWEDAAIAEPPNIGLLSDSSTKDTGDTFTLEDFSDLF